jgi:hypothetical protein
MFKKAAIAAVLLMFVSLPAFCGSIDFSGSGDGGTWSWDGSGPLTATSLGMSVKIVGSPNTYTIYMPTETFTSGPFLGGSGTSSDPWTFGPSASGSFTITGCVPPATTCTPVNLFSGNFDGTGEMGVQGTGSVLFTSTFAMGTVNSDLLSFLGFSSSQVNFTGTYQVTLSGTAPGSGLVASGDLVISPAPTVPEPASLSFIAIGLLGFGMMAVRRKLLRA